MNIEPQILNFKGLTIEKYCNFLIPDFKNKYDHQKIPSQIKYFYQYFKEFGCTHVYKETFYYSNAFVYDYASFHVYRSSADSKYCSRFIYFNLNEIEVKNIGDFINKFVVGKCFLTDLNLLGLNIIKPTHRLSHKFGVSLLKPYDKNISTKFTRFYNTITERSVNLLGKELKIKSSILNGQDELGLCSTSALYSITNWLAKTLDTKNYHPGELTKFLGKNFSNNGSRTLPSKGISTGQITAFIQHQKLTYDKFELKFDIDFKKTNINEQLIDLQSGILFIKQVIRAYNYACGFPILLGLDRTFLDPEKKGGLHNSVCVGFREFKPNEYKLGHLSNYMDRLYVCDDNIGSQTSVNFLDPGNLKESELKQYNPEINFNYKNKDVIFVNKDQDADIREEQFVIRNALNIFKKSIVEFPKRRGIKKDSNFKHLFSTINEEVFCVDKLNYLLIPIPRTITVTINTIKPYFTLIQDNFIIDIVLYKSNDLKNYYLQIDGEGLSNTQKEKFIKLLFHKYVWRVAIMAPVKYITEELHPIVDFIFDSNEQEESPNFLSSIVVFDNTKYDSIISLNLKLKNLIRKSNLNQILIQK
jgi:hypothetical protein